MILEIEDAEIEAMIVCVNEKFLGKEFLGRKINRELLESLPPGVDACGENGEYHSFVYNAPFFSAPIPIITGTTVHRKYVASPDEEHQWNTGFFFLDVTV